MKNTTRLLSVVVLALASAGCAIPPEMAPSATVTTAMPGSERFFRIDWEAAPDRADTRRLRGYVENTYGEAVARVQLLGQALDTSGAVVGQRLQWVHGAIPGFGRVYYEIPGMPAADNYRVTVWAYERIQSPNGGFVIR